MFWAFDQEASPVRLPLEVFMHVPEVGDPRKDPELTEGHYIRSCLGTPWDLPG